MRNMQMSVASKSKGEVKKLVLTIFHLFLLLFFSNLDAEAFLSQCLKTELHPETEHYSKDLVKRKEN